MDLFSTPLVLAFIRARAATLDGSVLMIAVPDRRGRRAHLAHARTPLLLPGARGDGRGPRYSCFGRAARVHVPMQGGGLQEEYWWEEAQIQSNIAE